MKNIVVAFSIASRAGQEWLAGIHAYAGRQGNWSIREINESETSSMCRGFDFGDADGLIRTTSVVLPPTIPAERIPTVCIVNNPAAPPVGASIIRNDNAAFAEKVASVFIARKLKNFAFMRFDKFSWEEERRDAFIHAVRSAGFDAGVFEPDLTTDEAHDRRRLAAWLRALPKPCGLMTSFDGRGRLVLEIARKEGIRVPDELCVIGVDNDVPVCERTLPMLSSFDPQFAKEGWLAAETLNAMMSGHIREPVTVVNCGGKVVERASSFYLPKSYRCAAIAMEVIKTRCAENLTVERIVEMSGVSRRLLELRFQELYGDSVQNKLRDARIERIKTQLWRSSMPIEEICALSGYTNISYIKRAFKAATGMTMREYRYGDRIEI